MSSTLINTKLKYGLKLLLIWLKNKYIFNEIKIKTNFQYKCYLKVLNNRIL